MARYTAAYHPKTKDMIKISPLVFLLFVCQALATTKAIYAFNDKEQEVTFNELTHQLRCLVCQNQDLADSHAPLAEQLKSIIHQKLVVGESKTAIIDFLTARYGDFILFKPKVIPLTYLLWFAPLLLLSIGVVGLLSYIKKQEKND